MPEKRKRFNKGEMVSGKPKGRKGEGGLTAMRIIKIRVVWEKANPL